MTQVKSSHIKAVEKTLEYYTTHGIIRNLYVLV